MGTTKVLKVNSALPQPEIISEAARIQIRARREDAVKRLKDSENKKEITEDDSFKGKEKIQKTVDKANAEVETMVDAKLAELGE